MVACPRGTEELIPCFIHVRIVLVAQKRGVATEGASPLTIHPLRVTVVAKRVFTPLYDQHFRLCSVLSSTSSVLPHTRRLQCVRHPPAEAHAKPQSAANQLFVTSPLTKWTFFADGSAIFFAAKWQICRVLPGQ